MAADDGIVAGSLDCNVTETDAAKSGFLASLNKAWATAFNPEIGETQIGQLRQFDAILDDNFDRPAGAIDADIREHDAADIRSRFAVFWQITFGIFECDSIMKRITYNQIVERTVSDDAIPGTPHPNAVGMTVYDAIAHGNVLADLLSGVHAPDVAQDQTVVFCLEKTVADGHIPACIDIDAVHVTHAAVSVDLDALNVDIPALHQPYRPAGRIDKSGVLQANLAAAVEHNNPWPGRRRFG